MKPSRFSVRRILLIIALVLIVIYAIAGFLFLPSFLKTKMEEGIATATGTTVSIGRVRVNPFALSLTLDDFSLNDKDGDSFFALKQLYVNFELRSVFTGAATFSEIAVDSPYVHIKLYADGTSNVPTFGHGDTVRTEKSPADSAKQFFVLIDRFALTRGRTVYEDRSHGGAARTARLDSLNLTLNEFTTRPKEQGEYAFDASTDRGERLSWHGTIQIAPLASSGSIAIAGFKAKTLWEFMQDRLNYTLTDGEFSAHAQYTFDMSGPKPQFALHHGGMSAINVRLADNATKTEQAVFPNAGIDGLELDYGTKSIGIASIAGSNARLRTTRDLKGNFGLTELLMMKPDPTAPKEAPWKIVLGKIALTEYSLTIEDQNTEPATMLELTPVAVTIEHYTVLSSQPAALTVAGAMKPAGTFTVKGTFTDEPITSQITLACSDVQLPLFQKFVDKKASLKLESGALAVNGTVKYAATSAVPTMHFTGSTRITDFRATDRIGKKDFLRWKSLDVKRIEFARSPASLAIGEITAQDPYIRFIIDSSRTSNVQRIMAVGADSTVRRDSLAHTDTVARAEAPTPTRIQAILVNNGSMNFADYSLSPNFVTGIQELNGSIVGLNSEQLSHAQISLDGKVDRYAPVEIRGEINPLSENTYTDIGMKFHNIELTTFTPYFGKFAGYKIDKGKLSLDLHYKLNKQFLEAENSIVVDQLTLGEKVDGPDVTSLPVRLAVALLKDSKGVIDLDLPLKGSLNDPEFSVFPIVLKVFVNLIVKAVSSPFKLLGSLLGSSNDDLSYVQFRPGLDSLEAGEQAKLDNLAKALTERPALKLDVRGLAGDSLDTRAIAEARLVRLLKQKGGNGQAVTEADNGRILQLYRERTGANPDSLAPALEKGASDEAKAKHQAAIASLARQKITASLIPTDDALLALARRRATAVKDRLVFHAGIPEGRIFLLDFQKGAKETDGLIQMPLSLDAE